MLFGEHKPVLGISMVYLIIYLDNYLILVLNVSYAMYENVFFFFFVVFFYYFYFYFFIYIYMQYKKEEGLHEWIFPTFNSKRRK
jgi:hypothetical protein